MLSLTTKRVIPTVIEYVILLAVIAIILFFALPISLYFLSFVPFLGISVDSFWSCVIFALVLSGLGIVALGLQYLNGRLVSSKILYFVVATALTFIQVTYADYLVKSVDLPLYLIIIYSIVVALSTGTKFQTNVQQYNRLKKEALDEHDS